MADLDVLEAHWRWESEPARGGAHPLTRAHDDARRDGYHRAAAELATARSSGGDDAEALAAMVRSLRSRSLEEPPPPDAPDPVGNPRRPFTPEQLAQARVAQALGYRTAFADCAAALDNALGGVTWASAH